MNAANVKAATVLSAGVTGADNPRIHVYPSCELILLNKASHIVQYFVVVTVIGVGMRSLKPKTVPWLRRVDAGVRVAVLAPYASDMLAALKEHLRHTRVDCKT